MASRALLIGLNYVDTPESKLNGCINDVNNMANYLGKMFPCMVCDIVTDETNKTDTTAQGIVKKLYELAVKSHSEDLEFVWIHYSGHGSYVKDTSGDELDGQDECIVPSDYKTAGLVSDDILQSLFAHFNPKTRVLCVFDCCHSGTLGDVKYCWDNPEKPTIENIKCRVKAKVITLSGCMDKQTSADAYNVMNDSNFTGALTSCLILSLKEVPVLRDDAFNLVRSIRQKLKDKGFDQYPKLCSSHNLAFDKRVF